MNISAQENSLKINPSDTPDNADLVEQVAPNQHHTLAAIMTEQEDGDEDADALCIFVCCAGILSGLFE